jgi:hypothetical protein
MSIKSLAGKQILVFISVLVLQTFLKKTSINESIPFLDLWDEFVVLFMLPTVFKSLHMIINNTNLVFLLIMVLIYWFFLILSSFFGEGGFVQGVYQFVLEAKYLIIFFYAICVYQGRDSQLHLDVIFRVLVLINIPFVFIQMFAPSFYDILFPNGAHTGMFYLQSGGALSRTAGIFHYTGLFAVFSSLSSIFFSTKLLIKYDKKDAMYLFLSILFLLTSLSRGEIFSFIIGFFVINYVYFTKKSVKPIIIVVMLLLGALSYFALESYIIEALNELGVGYSYSDNAPRSLFMNVSLQIANDYFPLGSGSGTFGGISAVVFDSVIFYKYLIAYEWYFDAGHYLTDTYWPKILGEAGVVGLIFNAMFMVYLPITQAIRKDVGFTSIYTTWVYVFLFFNSLSSPIYSSTLTIVLCAFLLGGIYPLKSNRRIDE